MRNHFSQKGGGTASSKQNLLLARKAVSFLKPNFRNVLVGIVSLAFACGALLLANDITWFHLGHFAHASISALPLLLIGLAALGFQFVSHPNRLALFKACIVSAAFLLWGIDQLLPTGWPATAIGDLVITLYVIDLGWMMLDRLKQQRQTLDATPAQEPARCCSSSYRKACSFLGHQEPCQACDTQVPRSENFSLRTRHPSPGTGHLRQTRA